MKGLKKIIILLGVCLWSSNIYAQEYNDARIDSLLDEILETKTDLYDLLDGNTKFHFIYANTSFSNKTMFAGREIGDNIYNLSGQLYYFISNGLYFGTSGAWYSQLDPGYRITAFTAGYSDGIKKLNLRYRASYARYLFHIDDYDPSFSNSLNLGATYKYNILGLRADYSLLFGKDFSSQVSLDLYAKILLIKLKGYDKIRLEPQISMYFSSEELEKDISTGDKTNPFYRPEYEQYEVFGWLNTEFELPLTISYKDFMIEFSYTYNLTRSLDPEYYYPNSHLFNFSLGYIFSL